MTEKERKKERTSMLLFEPIDGSGSPHVRRERYKTLLAPILEVRRVTFAARYIQDDLESSYTPVDVVRVKFIPHFSEYCISERRSTWYSTEEIMAMKQRAFRDIDTRRSEILFNEKYRKTSQQQMEYSCDIRGLERLVYNDDNTRARIRYESLYCLLQEQHQQRCWMYSVNNPGGITHPRDEYLQRIRHVAMVKGESILSQQSALQLAKQDEALADQYMNRKSNTDDQGDEASVTSDQPLQPQEQHQKYPERVLSPITRRKTNSPGNSKNKPSSSNDDCCWCVDVVEKVGQSLLVHALLSPFLKIQRGDALLVE